MKALTWQGRRSVRVTEVPDPVLQEPTDAVVRITSTAICGSDLHLYEVLSPYLSPGDVLGHEPMGIVEAVGSGVANLAVGDRVVIPFPIACGHCWSCQRGLSTQCETTQVREHGSGAALFGFSALYGSVPGGQAELLRVPHADFGPIKVGAELPDDRYLFLSDILPTAWQGVQYAQVPEGGSLAVLGLGPVGQFAARIGRHLGYDVTAVDPVPERRALAERHGITTVASVDTHEVVEQLQARTDGRGPDAVLDAVGMEAHGGPTGAVGKVVQNAAGFLPDKVAQKVSETAGIDRLNALHTAIAAVRRGGTVSLSGVYGGAASPMPLLTMFDKQIALHMGQCNVRSWVDDLLPLVEDPADPLGTADLTTHRVPLDDAADLYDVFQRKADGCIKVVLQP